ncbi:MAG: signal recognition particle-docking protein FtsY, partial [Hydrogenobacter sp.]
IIPICKELKVPVKLIGVGEGIDDLQPFDAELFVEELLSVEV